MFSRFYNCFIFVLYLFAGNELVANENFYQNDLFFSTSIEEERLRSYFFFWTDVKWNLIPRSDFD